MPENTCPTAEQLSRFSLGKLDHVQLEAVADHLEVCATCRSLIETLENRSDSLLEQLRSDLKPDPFGDEPELKKALDEVVDGNGRAPGSSSRKRVDLPAEFGRYRVLEVVGAGAMGTIHRAYDTRMDRQVALKVPNFGPNENPELEARFLRESKAAAGLDHPNICKIFDSDEIDGICFFSMPLLEGQSLAASLKSGCFNSAEEAARLIRDLALAMEEAHTHGVVHRDLKPENIMINKRGEPIVTDFGLASRTEELLEGARLSQNGMLIGTAAYMSPEQVNTQVNLFGPRCDIYSLGVILFELLTREQPYRGALGELLAQIARDPVPRASSRRKDVPPALDEICFQAMAKDPNHRFSSMAEFAARLDDFLKNSPIQGSDSRLGNAIRLVAPIEPPTRQSADKPRFVDFVRKQKWLLLVLLLLLGLIAIYWPSQSPDTGEHRVKFKITRSTGRVTVDDVEYTRGQLEKGILLSQGRHFLKIRDGEIIAYMLPFVVDATPNREIIFP